jgi:hypothetical protein
MKRKMTSDCTSESASIHESAKLFVDDPDHHAILARRNWLVALALAGMASTTACSADDLHGPNEAGADQAGWQTSNKADATGTEVAVTVDSGKADSGWGDDCDSGTDAPTCQGCQGGMCQGCT